MIREKISSKKEAHYFFLKKKPAKLAMAAKSEAVQQFLGGDWTDLTLIRLGFWREVFS